MKRLKQFEVENARLKKLLAERGLEIEVIDKRSPQKMVSVPARRSQWRTRQAGACRGGGPAR